jgi:pyruvate formate lyase activating enzyme
MDPAEHRLLASADNAQILGNARFLVEADAPVCFRFPAVPRMTANTENVRAIAKFLTELGMKEIELCLYHENWLNKLSWLQSDRSPQTELLRPLSDEEMIEVMKAFSDMGVLAKSKETLVNSVGNTAQK